MGTILSIFKIILLLLIIIAISGFALQILFTSVGYLFGYLYDCIFGNWFIKLGHYVGKKHKNIKKVKFIKLIWSKMQPRKLYLRYETPFISYCFSYMAIYFISLIIPTKNSFFAFFIGTVLYIFLYFLGMFRRCGKDGRYFTTVLENNLSFLKLSFWPLGGIITMVGFVCTISAKGIAEFSLSPTIIENILSNLQCLYDSQNIIVMVIFIIVVYLVLILILYVISIPVQVTSYFIILLINYFRENKKAYCKLIEIYWKGIIRIYKYIFS